MSNLINIKRDSTTHLALLYLKMKNTFVSVQDLFKLSPAKYKSSYKAQRALDTLVSQGLATNRDNMYHITSNGIQACYRITREQRRTNE
jgi:hypothetical protein